MTALFLIKPTGKPPCSVENLTNEDMQEIEKAAKFRSVCGRRADSILSDETGLLWLIDSCGESHAVDPHCFVAVRP